MGPNKAIVTSVSGALLLAGFLAVDCGGSTASQPCVPGATQVCVGPGACMGGQACRSDGTGFEPCNCGGVPGDAGPDVSVGNSSSGSGDAAVEAGPWDCLGAPNQMFPANATTTVHLITANSAMPILTAQQVDGGSALDLVQYTPFVGEQVRACPEILDGTCAGGSAWQTSDDAGVASFTLPNTFDGYYQFNDPNLFTTAFYPSPMLAGATEATVPATLLPQALAQEIGVLLKGVTLSTDTDGGLGHIVLTVYDCQDHTAPGVVFIPSATAPPGSPYPTLVFYTVGNRASPLPTTGATATDNSGTGGMLNVPTGGFTVKASLASDGRQLGLINLRVNPGVASSAILRIRTH